MNVIYEKAKAVWSDWRIRSSSFNNRGDFVSLGEPDPRDSRKRDLTYRRFADGKMVVAKVYEFSLIDPHTEQPRVLESGGYVEIFGGGVAGSMPKEAWEQMKIDFNKSR